MELSASYHTCREITAAGYIARKKENKRQQSSEIGLDSSEELMAHLKIA